MRLNCPFISCALEQQQRQQQQLHEQEKKLLEEQQKKLQDLMRQQEVHTIESQPETQRTLTMLLLCCNEL
jgi:single-stranded DNA-specific DHH superfamily exonuclease